ncbi:ferredoxin [[Mycobacterium] nativiensis]|uniref:Ferredoxin n=1 Tax=[Mycobacterium] nativiensis TaxID=2855503 RepID=A0ABU5Y212_9MYCO|nr:ferredoxin [Mycolicibacter sp. MYC340]MEB3034279.1 ferredoxin [Mycolicibacter sp. MYC340]
MRVVADRDKCMGNGLCEAVHPAVFAVGDDGVVIVHDENVRAEDRRLLEQAVAACPAFALRLVDDD